ncbi:flagellar biosynthetic protein FliR [Desulfofustis glycolicus]|uniref:Flagellar biosynthetic protein FliR n=1 Tax=Desulfofustis glycolicus DSM 9705 TaxID=1121409 RepID=A0A1M5U1H4_9BACT|nr:flagellar biosynthetic protein FliR [Desulfofustis glycolicus]MCB2214716.1 flagellar biosynthetic protein FliR [Desulfobulbaceae bacterium]SHH56706.1 flagellar biosynthetic protein FliR [Desulfofustis glycolicus DSM 9705]
MAIELVPIEQFQIFLICAARIAGFIGAIPVFSGAQTPVQLKAGLVFVVSLVLFPAVASTLPSLTTFEPATFIVFLVSEVLIGAIIGLIARLIFTAVEFGGTIIGYQMGFAAANVFDPQNERQISLISQMQNVFAVLIFLAISGHHVFIRTAVESYRILPPGGIDFSGEAVPFLMELASHMFVLGVQFSAPVLAVLLLSGLILGILARTFPQGNVFLLSFPLNIAIAFTVIGLTLGMVFIVLSREFDNLADHFFTMLTLLNG